MNTQAPVNDWKLLLALAFFTLLNLGVSGATLYLMAKQCWLDALKR